MSRKNQREELGIKEEQLTTSWRTLGTKMNIWFSLGNSYMEQATGRPSLPQLKDLTKLIIEKGKETGQGAAEMFRAIKRGDWKLFKTWAKENPFAALAGLGAIVGVGVLAGAAVTGLVSGAGGLWAWATTGSTGLMAAIKGSVAFGTAGSVLAGLTKGGVALYNFEWQETDEQIDKAIDQAITNLYEPMGEFLGRSLAGITVAGLTRPPRIEINVTQIALVNEINEDIADDLNDAVTDFI